MMNVYLNGKQCILAHSSTLDALISVENPDYFAVAVNQRVIPRSQYHLTPLQEGDHIEFIVPMQGG